MNRVMTYHQRRSVLVAPASDERKALKALRSAADEVVLDLEDAVAPAQKVAARESTRALLELHSSARTVSVRINAPGSPWYADDVGILTRYSGLATVVVPKASSPSVIEDLDRALLGSDTRIQALLETPDGILNARKICAASDRMEAVIIGYADLGAAIGRSTGDPAKWIGIQDMVLLAARSSGIQAIDGPDLKVAVDDDFERSARLSSDLGFDGKWVIHPSQIDTVRTAFTPTAGQVEHAERVIESLGRAAALGSGAALLDGRMLDEAVAVAARRVLAQVGVQ